jgi:hypothetical protein
MSNNDDRTPPEIERDIARTRGDLAQTLDALERRLDPRRIAEKGIDMLSNNLLNSETVNRGVEAVRANPIPVALIGIGAAWLAASSTGMVDRLAKDERIEAVRRRVGDFADDVGQKASDMASSVAGTIGLGGGTNDDDSSAKPLGHTGNPIVDASADQGNGWMHQVSGMAQDTLRSARETMIDVPVGYASDGASRIADKVSGAFERHPLAVGAVGIMAGMLVAALLPMTKMESDLLGDSSNQLWQKAREAGEDVVTRVRDTATQAATKVAGQVAAEVTEQAINALNGDSDATRKGGSDADKPA